MAQKRTRLTDRSIRYAIRQRQKGESPSRIATELGISARYVRKLWAEFQGTGEIPVLHKAGRPKKVMTQDMVSTVLDWYARIACRGGPPCLQHQEDQSRHKLS